MVLSQNAANGKLFVAPCLNTGPTSGVAQANGHSNGGVVLHNPCALPGLDA